MNMNQTTSQNVMMLESKTTEFTDSQVRPQLTVLDLQRHVVLPPTVNTFKGCVEVSHC